MSKAHVPVPVIAVIHKETKTALVVNEADFNAEIHEKVKGERPRLPDAPPAPPTGDALEKELAGLSIAQLKEHPLYAKVEDAGQYTKKAALIEAMLKAA